MSTDFTTPEVDIIHRFLKNNLVIFSIYILSTPQDNVCITKQKHVQKKMIYQIKNLFLVVPVRKSPLDRICLQWIKASFTQVWGVRLVQNGLLGHQTNWNISSPDGTRWAENYNNPIQLHPQAPPAPPPHQHWAPALSNIRLNYLMSPQSSKRYLLEEEQQYVWRVRRVY